MLPSATLAPVMTHRILVIEDNEQSRYLLTYLLEAHAYQVFSLSRGTAAVQHALQIQPHLVLLDIQLPQMDGYAVARALRADPRLPPMPIVAITSYAMPGDREQALAAGCDGYLEKPLNPDTLISEVRKFLGDTVRADPACDA